MEEPSPPNTVMNDDRASQHGASLPRPPTSTPTLERSLKASVSHDQDSVYPKGPTNAAVSSQAAESTQFGEACMKPKHPLTAHELQALRKPGDVVATEEGHRVKMVENEHGERLFQSSLPSPVAWKSPTELPGSSPKPLVEASEESSGKTPHKFQRSQSSQSFSSHPASRGSSVSSKASTQRKRTRAVTRLTAIDTQNIIGGSGDESEHPSPATPPKSSAPASSYSFRARNAGQSGLKYDIKYHPMDDAVRPSQAAKRRSLHGDLPILSTESDDTDEMSSMCAQSSDESNGEMPKKEVKKRSRPTIKGMKRTRPQSEAHEPVRRSTRQTADVKVLYDMSVHPQDHDLIMLSSEDGEAECKLITKRKKYTHSKAVVIKSDTEDSDDDVMSSVEDSDRGVKSVPVNVPEITIKTSSPLSSVAVTPPHGIRRKEGLDVWLQAPGERYFKHDRDSWLPTSSQPFQIYESSFEEQMEAAASAASPLAFDHDDKENDVSHPSFDEPPHPTDGMSVMPASQYWRTTEDSNASRDQRMVDEAFFRFEHVSSPYGLGVDGAVEEQNHIVNKGSTPTAMSILLSGSQLPSDPSGTVEEQADEVNSVPSLTPSSDSILSRGSTIELHDRSFVKSPTSINLLGRLEGRLSDQPEAVRIDISS